MELTNDVYNSINSYFSILSHTGYKSYTEVDKLLVYSFIEELLTGPMSFYITEDDYTSIMNSVECMYGTCLMPYPNYKESFDEVVNNTLNTYRVSEINVLRNTEDYSMRIKN